jgi:hypothetical protein
VLLAALASCIVPDRDIRIDPGFDNEGAVRIVQRPPRTPEMDEICNLPEKHESLDLAYCPEVRTTRRSGLIRPLDGGDFCVCPGESTDKRAIASFEIYAEDGDVEGDRAQDTIYGVALLDLDPATTEPQGFVAYENYWGVGAAGERIAVGEDASENRTAPPIGRESTQLWVFPLDDGDGDRRIDLCNDDNGSPLDPGLHSLRFMVTDRPFFRPPSATDDEAFAPPQPGVPDLAAGATYATIDYVFECMDAALDPPGCEPIPEDPETPMCTCDCSSLEDE